MGLLDQLQSFGQGASNAVASNVSAPVDGIAWLLRKAGIPMPPNPMGGSDWMMQKGLTPAPQERNAGLLGEFAGMAGPMVAAAKAPQVAKGLLQMADNAMAPATMNPQTGAIVWHGSPHKFDKFDSSKIGTGEGAQAYGHGIYAADSQDVAKGYRAAVTSGQQGFGFKDGDARNGIATLIAAKGDQGEQIARKAYANLGQSLDGFIADAKLAVDNSSSLYKVDLPDEHIAKMLDWDKPMSQQSQGVRDAMQSPQVQAQIQQLKQSGKLGDYSPQELNKLTGEDWHDMLRQASSDSNIAPSDFLRSQGIPGIRYLDGGSRAGGAGSSNYVVFPGNEGLLNILERNGQKLK